MVAHGTQYELEKSVWTEADFDQMGWHDSRIHGICFYTEKYQILLDIDYIYAWVSPAPDSKYYSFWVSPCTLVFENICDLKIELESENLEILDLKRSESGRPLNAEFIDKFIEWTWLFDIDGGEISFRSVGFKQFVRQLPQHISQQHFTLSERGGVSFEMCPIYPL